MPEETTDGGGADLGLQAAPAPAAPPTLDDAFATLAGALLPLLEEDIPTRLHLQEVMGWHADGNQIVSWQHLAHLLEGVLGHRLTLA